MFWTIAPNNPSAFDDYSNGLRALQARTAMQPRPLVDWHAPDDNDDGAYVGTVGVFRTMPAIPNVLGPWYPDYQGIVPVSAQQQITAPEPWLDANGDFNG